MNTKSIAVNFSELIGKSLRLLSSKEQEVISRRFSLQGGRRHTLDKIGKSFSITRERVRQIEAVALKKLERISADPVMHGIHQLALEVIKKNGSVMSEDMLISGMLKEMRVEDLKEVDVNAMKLAMRACKDLIKQEKNQFYRIFWRTTDIALSTVKEHLKQVKSVLKAAGDVMTATEVANAMQGKGDPQMAVSLLHVDWAFQQDANGSWGMTSWRHINPRSIKDRINIILNEENKPLHFSEVANRVMNDFRDKKVVTKQAVHNELIRHPEFVLVGRGLYGLKEWNMISGKVCDVIKAVLQEHKTPMRRQDIITGVLQKRDIRLGTISLNLQKYPFFERVGRAVYIYNADLDNRKRRKRRSKSA